MMNNFSSLDLCSKCTMLDVKDERHCNKCKSDWNANHLPCEFTPNDIHLQYLKEIRDDTRSHLRIIKTQRFFQIVVALIIILALAIAAFGIIKYIPIITKLVDNVSTLVTKITELTNSLNAVNFATLAQSSETVLKQSAEGLTSIITKVDSLDITTLNTSIKALSDIIEPLSRLFRR